MIREAILVEGTSTVTMAAYSLGRAGHVNEAKELCRLLSLLKEPLARIGFELEGEFGISFTSALDDREKRREAFDQALKALTHAILDLPLAIRAADVLEGKKDAYERYFAVCNELSSFLIEIRRLDG